MQRFVQFSPWSHSPAYWSCHLAGDQYVRRPNKVCMFYDGVAIADERLDVGISFNVQPVR